jgi:hypothetical protein
MFDIAHLYNLASSYSVKPIRLHPIFMSIIFHHYKQLTMIAKQIEANTQKDPSSEPFNYYSLYMHRIRCTFLAITSAIEISQLLLARLTGPLALS